MQSVQVTQRVSVWSWKSQPPFSLGKSWLQDISSVQECRVGVRCYFLWPRGARVLLHFSQDACTLLLGFACNPQTSGGVCLQQASSLLAASLKFACSNYDIRAEMCPQGIACIEWCWFRMVAYLRLTACWMSSTMY